MNIIDFKNNETTVIDLLDSLIIRGQERYRETAFIGCVGSGGYGLWLISFNNIVSISNPFQTFSGYCPVRVERFVNLKIEVSRD